MSKFAILLVVFTGNPCVTALAQSGPRCGDWLPLTNPDGQGLDGRVRAMATFDAGDGPTLHVGGGFPTLLGLPGGPQPGYIARWWPRPPCAADLNGDGVLTIFDFLAFQTAFDAGCP